MSYGKTYSPSHRVLVCAVLATSRRQCLCRLPDVAVAKLWKKFPGDVNASQSLTVFRRQLKSVLFCNITLTVPDYKLLFISSNCSTCSTNIDINHRLILLFNFTHCLLKTSRESKNLEMCRVELTEDEPLHVSNSPLNPTNKMTN